MILKNDDKVTYKEFKDYLLIVSKITDDEYLVYSPSLRYSRVLNVKELKKIK